MLSSTQVVRNYMSCAKKKKKYVSFEGGKKTPQNQGKLLEMVLVSNSNLFCSYSESRCIVTYFWSHFESGFSKFSSFKNHKLTFRSGMVTSSSNF